MSQWWTWPILHICRFGLTNAPNGTANQLGGKHAQLEPHGPGGKSSPRVDDAPRDGAATIDSNLLSFELPHCGHFG
jgi:hypothetical protein